MPLARDGDGSVDEHTRRLGSQQWFHHHAESTWRRASFFRCPPPLGSKCCTYTADKSVYPILFSHQATTFHGLVPPPAHLLSPVAQTTISPVHRWTCRNSTKWLHRLFPSRQCHEQQVPRQAVLDHHQHIARCACCALSRRRPVWSRPTSDQSNACVSHPPHQPTQVMHSPH